MSTRVEVLISLLCVGLGCGGGKPAEVPTGGGATKEKVGTTEKPSGKEDDGTSKPKKAASKYPEPFLEPDCSSVATDGYLPDAKKVMAGVRQAHWDKLKACADAAPPGENLSGEIRTTFRLDPDGVPRCVEAPGSSMSNQDVVNCVVAVYRTFRFSTKPKNGSVRITDGIRLDVKHDDDDDD